MKKLRTIGEVKSFKGKRVLLRLDLNVPLAKGKVVNDAKILAAIPTIEKLLNKGAIVVAVSHLGRPNGWEHALSLAPVAKRLEKLIGRKVGFISDSLDDDEKVDKKIAKLKGGQLACLENVRFYSQEEKNGSFLSRRLAALCDIFVDDAFAVSHRAHASNVGVAKLRPSYAGLLMEKEIKNLTRLFAKPKKPFVVLMGGWKMSTKLPALKKMLELADTVLVGGGIANSLIRAKGWRTGKSFVSPADVKLAKKLLNKKNLIVPKDLLAASSLKEDAEVRVCRPGEVRMREYVVDIGPQTVREYAYELRKAKTIAWNGPLGVIEVPKFSHASVALGRVVAARSSGKAYGVVGGGETLICLAKTGMAEFVDHISTGGGAMLDFLAGKKMPGIEILTK